ncbi:hypothetical protein QBC38DRAFT_51704 [Podospora fimiseda]|uniref:Protein kinase domain-containing protein n=1 Tax=Podospora fimiseda TaxID=252190 RepID=A0AAN7GSC4_9PEZI|nr:hypothetical protein QBC38DRAFT_51704 [Podospora fimiseda]
MEPGPALADELLFPTAAHYQPPKTTEEDTPWPLSPLNPASRINSLDCDYSTPQWEIEGAEPDGRHYWVIPNFARGQPPRWIDVYYQPGDLEAPGLRLLKPTRRLLALPSNRRGQLDLGRHILRALEYWSSRVNNFAQKYKRLPLGSQIAINRITADVRFMDITLVPDYDLERQWLSAEDLKQAWGFSEDFVLPTVINIDKLKYKRRLAGSICLVEVSGQEQALGELIFKCQAMDVKAIYRELRNLFWLPVHPNLPRRPLFLVSKKVRFGGKRGICGFVTEFFPTGTIDSAIRRHQREPGGLPLSLRLSWAKDLACALIAIRNSPLKCYTDLKLDNVVLSDDTLHAESNHAQAKLAPSRAVLIDFEQGTPWIHWAPPEIYWINYIERLASGTTVSPATRARYASMLHPLLPGWMPEDRRALYTTGDRSHCHAWSHLNEAEGESAMVYMLGKALWCLAENVFDVIEPATFSSFLAVPSVPIFPSFSQTPQNLRECIIGCTSGAPEWDGRRQPFHVRDGRVHLRDNVGGCLSNGTHAADQVLAVSKEWWGKEIEDAERFVNLRVNGLGDESDRTFISFMHTRPTLEEVLKSIEAAIKEAGVR